MRSGKGRKGKLVLKKQDKFAQEKKRKKRRELRNRSFEKGMDGKIE